MEEICLESFIDKNINNIIKKLNVYAYSSNNIIDENIILEDFEKLKKEFKKNLKLVYQDERLKLDIKLSLGDPLLYNIIPENNFTLFILNGYGYDKIKDMVIEADKISERYYIDNMDELYNLILNDKNKKIEFKKG